MLLDDLAKEKLRVNGFEIVGNDSSATTDAADRTTHKLHYVLTTYRVDTPMLTIEPISARYYQRRPGQRLQDMAPAGEVQIPGAAVSFRSTIPENQPTYALRDGRDSALAPRVLRARRLDRAGAGRRVAGARAVPGCRRDPAPRRRARRPPDGSPDPCRSSRRARAPPRPRRHDGRRPAPRLRRDQHRRARARRVARRRAGVRADGDGDRGGAGARQGPGLARGSQCAASRTATRRATARRRRSRRPRRAGMRCPRRNTCSHTDARFFIPSTAWWLLAAFAVVALLKWRVRWRAAAFTTLLPSLQGLPRLGLAARAVRDPRDRRRVHQPGADAAGDPVLADRPLLARPRHRPRHGFVVEHAGGDGLGPGAGHEHCHDAGGRAWTR